MANSASAQMVSGDTDIDKAVEGYLARERITLTVTGSPDAVLWGLSKPNSSGSVSGIDAPTDPTCTFSPDVEGYYVVTCLVDGETLYILRIAVVQVTSISTVGAFRLAPVAEVSVPAPASGATVFYSLDRHAVVAKASDGSITTL